MSSSFLNLTLKVYLRFTILHFFVLLMTLPLIYVIMFFSQIGYSQSALLLAYNLIKEVPTHRFRLGGLEAGDFLDKVKQTGLLKIPLIQQSRFLYSPILCEYAWRPFLSFSITISSPAPTFPPRINFAANVSTVFCR